MSKRPDQGRKERTRNDVEDRVDALRGGSRRIATERDDVRAGRAREQDRSCADPAPRAFVAVTRRARAHRRVRDGLATNATNAPTEPEAYDGIAKQIVERGYRATTPGV